MFAFGFLGLVFGAYLIDCAVTGKHPMTTLQDIIRNPTDVKGTLTRNTGAIVPTLYMTSGGTTSEKAAENADAAISTKPNGGSNSAPGGVAPSGKVGTVIAFCRAQIGKPYVWGGHGPNSWDCSGLTNAAYRKVGKELGYTTYQQVLKGKAVTKGNLIPGDLVFPTPTHVQLYIGGGRIIEAPRTGLDVRESVLGHVWKARRIV